MRRSKGIDDIDRKIVKIIAMKPDIGQVELANKLEMTQPAISLRLAKLRRNGILNDKNVVIDPSIINFKLFQIEIHGKNNEKVIEKVKRCPMIINCYNMEGNNLSLIAIGESKEFLNCMIHKHLKVNGINEINPRSIFASIKGVNLSTIIDNTRTLPPCGDQACLECNYYIDNGGECVGCPLTIYYKGKLWST